MTNDLEYSPDVSFGATSTPTTAFSFPNFGGQVEETTPGFWGSLTNNPLLGKLDQVLGAYIDVEKYKNVKKIDAKYATVQGAQTPQNADPLGQQTVQNGSGSFSMPLDMIILLGMGFLVFKIASE